VAFSPSLSDDGRAPEKGRPRQEHDGCVERAVVSSVQGIGALELRRSSRPLTGGSRRWRLGDLKR
jgi:hypothetical protein